MDCSFLVGMLPFPVQHPLSARLGMWGWVSGLPSNPGIRAGKLGGEVWRLGGGILGTGELGMEGAVRLLPKVKKIGPSLRRY